MGICIERDVMRDLLAPSQEEAFGKWSRGIQQVDAHRLELRPFLKQSGVTADVETRWNSH